MSIVGAPRRPEIDEYAIKFLIGVIAFSLPLIELALTGGSITSISASFWFDTLWPRNFFVGFLYCISAFLVAYNGRTALEMWLAKIASIAAFLIAMFPCECKPSGREIIKYVHVLSATTMFAVLACFCVIFIRRARQKPHPQAHWRAMIYAICGVGMVVSIGLFAAKALTGVEVFTLWGETAGLVSFGISWLTASKVIPGISGPAERTKLFG